MNPPLLRNVLESLAYEPDRLIGLILQQSERISELSEGLKKAHDRIAQLQQQLQQAQRESKRQAAPFRRPKDKRVVHPPPGRGPGHRGSYRKAHPGQPDEQIERLLNDCPHRHCDLSEQAQRQMVQNILEIPKLTPTFVRLTTYQCECPGCGQLVCSEHPLKVSEATGAAGTHLGPNALAVACSLNKDMGLTMRKTCRTLEQLFGLCLSPGGSLKPPIALLTGSSLLTKSCTTNCVKAPLSMWTKPPGG